MRLLFALLLAAAIAGLLVWSLKRQPATSVSPTGVAPTSTHTSTQTSSARSEEPVVAPREPTGPLESAAPPRDSVRLRGRVVDPSGRGVSGASIAVRAHGAPIAPPGTIVAPAPVFRAASDADGAFALDGPAPGEIAIDVRAAGFAPLERVQLLPPGTPADPTDIGELRIAAGIALAGRVLDFEGKAVRGATLTPMADALASLRPLLARAAPEVLARTDGDGKFRIDALAPGPWRFAVAAAGHPTRIVEGEGPGEIEVRLAEPASIAGRLEAAQANAGAIFGRAARGEITVRAQRVGDPVELGLDSENLVREGAVDGEGRFEIRGLAAGVDWRVRAFAKRGASSEGLGESAGARSGDRDVVLRLDALASITFRALDARTQAPLANVRVQLFGEPIEDRPESLSASLPSLAYDPATGVAVVGGLAIPSWGGSHRLTIEGDAHAPVVQGALVLHAGQRLDLGDLHLEPLPRIRAIVLDAGTNTPLAGARIQLLDPERRLPGATDGVSSRPDWVTGEFGTVDLEFERATPCALWAEHAGYADARLLILDPRHPPDANIAFALDRGGALLVTLVADDGSPRAGRAVGARRARALDGETRYTFADREVRAWTDAKGVARFEHLVPGVYEVWSARLANDVLGFATSEEASVRAGEESALTLREPREIQLAGTVTEAGRALAGARVTYFPGPLASLSQLNPWFLEEALHTTSAADGSFALAALPEPSGPVALVVEHRSRALPTIVELAAPFPSPLSIELAATVLQGRVLTSRRTPAADVLVLVRTANESEIANTAMQVNLAGVDEPLSVALPLANVGRTRTDALGRYTLRGVTPNADLAVSASSTGLASGASVSVRSSAAGVVACPDLVLAAEGAVRVSLRSARGERLEGSRVIARSLEPGPHAGRAGYVDSRNVARLEGLAVGRTELTFVGGGELGACPTTTCVVADGETAEVLFELP